jgi:hypothetical protein
MKYFALITALFMCALTFAANMTIKMLNKDAVE